MFYVCVCTKWRCIVIFVDSFGYHEASWLKFEARSVGLSLFFFINANVDNREVLED